uniref:RING-type domain-containing protein n=1 Tax=Myripristis murdjan TaxID=586833 RepID=A0A667XEJ1_9TELE
CVQNAYRTLLLCGHSFCRKCITNSLSIKDQCPQCRTTVPKEEKYFPTTSHILKSLGHAHII